MEDKLAYLRGWQDCLTIIDSLIQKAENLGDFKSQLSQLQVALAECLKERIRIELKVYDIF